MSSLGSANEASKKRERVPGELDATDSAKRAKSQESTTPSQAASYSTYAPYNASSYHQGYPTNYANYPQYSHAQNQYGASYGYGAAYSTTTAPGASTSTSKHTSYSTYSANPTGNLTEYAPVTYAPGVDPLAAPSAVAAKEEPAAPKHLRYAAGHVWEDPTLAEWPENDFRIHIGNLGPEVDDKVLHDAFKKYSTLAHWKVIRDKKYDLSKGFGFLSFLDPREGVKVLKEMNNKYVGQRPCKLQKSAHDKRNYSGPQDKSKKHR